MKLAIERAEQYRRDEPWITSTFVIGAIRDKLAKMARSRAKRTKRKDSKGQQPTTPKEKENRQ